MVLRSEAVSPFMVSKKDKLWMVYGNSVIEMKDYLFTQFTFTHGKVEPMYSMGSRRPLCVDRRGVFTLDISILSPTIKHQDGVDLSDFYSLKEFETLGRALTKKLKKANKNGEKL